MSRTPCAKGHDHLKFHQIRALVAVHQTGSLSEASQILHVTQPALSRSIKELEGELGLSLMQRSHKGMTLTVEGRRLIRHAQSSLESLRRLQLEAENIKDMQVGEVAIGVTSLTAVLEGLGASITAFQARSPRVRIKVVELRPSQIIQQIRDGTLDFAITSQQHTQRLNLDWEGLSRMPGLVVCRKSHPLRNARSLRHLLQANWVSLDAVTDQSSQFYQMFEQNQMQLPSRVTECSSVVLALHLLHHCDALMTLSEAGLDNILTQGLSVDLVQVRVDESIPEYPIYLVCTDRHSLTTSARDLYFEARASLSVGEQ
jgi:DNA-binding transcriptional LysR family regulator